MSKKKTIPVEYTIDKGVPVRVTSSKYPLEELEVGDSFVVPKEKRRSVATRMTLVKNATGREFLSRSVSDTEVRVWRIK